jgi:hypothetical protein
MDVLPPVTGSICRFERWLDGSVGRLHPRRWRADVALWNWDRVLARLVLFVV